MPAGFIHPLDDGDDADGAEPAAGRTGEAREKAGSRFKD